MGVECLNLFLNEKKASKELLKGLFDKYLLPIEVHTNLADVEKASFESSMHNLKGGTSSGNKGLQLSVALHRYHV